EALEGWLAVQGLEAAGAPEYAYYNDPFTPAFMRRNEVMIELAP
ncbi:MAG: heme-binding protein, partial [Pseudomonadota bacterium]